MAIRAYGHPLENVCNVRPNFVLLFVDRLLQETWSTVRSELKTCGQENVGKLRQEMAAMMANNVS